MKVNKRQKRVIGIVIAAGIAGAATWIALSIEGREIRGNILVLDAKTKQPVPEAVVLFEISRDTFRVYPPKRPGFVTAIETDRQGLAPIPDISGSDWISATYFRICVLSDKHRYYAKQFSRGRFGKDGSDCRAIRIKLKKKRVE